MGNGSWPGGGGDVVALPAHQPGRPADRQVARVVEVVCAECGIAARDLMGRSRRGPVSRARQIAMYLCHVVLGKTITTVGLLFGRDRSTASHACAFGSSLASASSS